MVIKNCKQLKRGMGKMGHFSLIPDIPVYPYVDYSILDIKCMLNFSMGVLITTSFGNNV